MRTLLDEMPHLKALVCLNDQLALGAYQALTERGLRVPEDVSVVSFDNDEIASYLRPGLMTILLPHEEMGAPAVQLLLGSTKNREHLVEMPVTIRASIKQV